MTRTGGDLIASTLRAHGVGTVFSVAGASHAYLLDALDRAGIRIVSSRHESGAVGEADGYARVKGGLGVALIVADQGLPNAIGGLAVAWHALSPVLVLVATPPRDFTEADGAIDQDQLALVSPLTKWARTAPSMARLQDHLDASIKHAITGRPGPTVLLVPENLLSEAAPAALVASTPFAMPSRPQPERNAIEAAARAIAEAKRPLIVAGAGAAWGDAAEGLRSLVHEFKIPLLANGLGRGLVPEDFETVMSWPYGQAAARHADCVLVVGARLTQRLGLGLPPRFATDAVFIQIDIEPSAFHRNRPVDVAIHADAGAALRALAKALKSKRPLAHAGHGWMTEALRSRTERVDALKDRDTDPIHPLRLGAAIAERLPSDAVYVGDGADIQTWMYGAIAIQRARGFLDHYPMGAMGSGTPLAVGAAAAQAEQWRASGQEGAPPPVVLVTGDGAIGFLPAELHAAALSGLRLVVVVGNDGAWGTEAHGQQRALGRTINTRLGKLPYEKLGEAFGGKGAIARTVVEMAGALDDAFAAQGVFVVNVELDETAGAELKTNADVRMILFSDIVEGQSALGIRRRDPD